MFHDLQSVNQLFRLKVSDDPLTAERRWSICKNLDWCSYCWSSVVPARLDSVLITSDYLCMLYLQLRYHWWPFVLLHWEHAWLYKQPYWAANTRRQVQLDTKHTQPCQETWEIRHNRSVVSYHATAKLLMRGSSARLLQHRWGCPAPFRDPFFEVRLCTRSFKQPPEKDWVTCRCRCMLAKQVSIQWPGSICWYETMVLKNLPHADVRVRRQPSRVAPHLSMVVIFGYSASTALQQVTCVQERWTMCHETSFILMSAAL